LVNREIVGPIVEDDREVAHSPQGKRRSDPMQPVMERSHPTSGRPATPADINRNGRPTSIGTSGRHQSECPADIIGMRNLVVNTTYSLWLGLRGKIFPIESLITHPKPGYVHLFDLKKKAFSTLEDFYLSHNLDHTRSLA
jgi:hypothetical protein